MIRFGVHRGEQFSAAPGLLHQIFHGNRVSYQLLRTATPATAGDLQRFDSIVYHLKLAGGVYTTTVPGRFRDLDLWLTDYLERTFPLDQPLLVEDWASSGAITSAEWFPVLRARFPLVRLVASDLNLYLIEASVDDDGVYILDPDGRPLQYIAPPFVIKFPEPGPFLVNRWLAGRARTRLQRMARDAGADLSALRFDRADQEIRRPPFVFRPLWLANPRARALADMTSAFQLAQHSVFTASPRKPDVVRTMNILNHDYFSNARLSEAVRAVWDSLRPGGVWIVGRTINESPVVHHVSLLRKTPAGFEPLARYTEKSEVEDLALAWQS